MNESISKYQGSSSSGKLDLDATTVLAMPVLLGSLGIGRV